MRGWRREAACWGSEVNFHSEKNTLPAKTLCLGCPVRRECLAWSVRTERRDNMTMPGIWGGLTPSERRERYPLDKTRYRQAERKLA